MYSAFISCLSRLQFFFDKVCFTKNYSHCLHVFYFAFQVKVVCAYLLFPAFSSSIRSEGLTVFSPCLGRMSSVLFSLMKRDNKVAVSRKPAPSQGEVMGCKCLPALPPVIPEALLYVISLRNNCLGSTLKFNIDTVMWVPGGLGVNTQTLLLLFYFQLWSPMEEKQLGVLHELSKTLGIIGRLLLHSRGRRKEFSLDCVHSVC